MFYSLELRSFDWNIKKKTEYNTSQSTDSLTNRFICEYLLINIVSVLIFRNSLLKSDHDI